MNAIDRGRERIEEAARAYHIEARKNLEILERTAKAYAVEELEKMAGEFMSEAIIEGLKVEGMATEDHDWPDAFATWSTLKHANTKLTNRIKELKREG